MSLSVFKSKLESAFEAETRPDFVRGMHEALNMLNAYIAENKPDDAEQRIARARELFTGSQSDDNIEVDDDAEFSETDSGCWVSAWLFVHDEEMDGDGEDGDDDGDE